jgi:hypothetical protein
MSKQHTPIPPSAQYSVCNVTYVKDNGDSSDRFIVPVSVPSHLVNAIDVTELPEQERMGLATARAMYGEYIQGILKAAFSFEDWAEHEGRTLPAELKHRSFKVQGLDYRA